MCRVHINSDIEFLSLKVQTLNRHFIQQPNVENYSINHNSDRGQNCQNNKNTLVVLCLFAGQNSKHRSMWIFVEEIQHLKNRHFLEKTKIHELCRIMLILICTGSFDNWGGWLQLAATNGSFEIYNIIEGCNPLHVNPTPPPLVLTIH